MPISLIILIALGTVALAVGLFVLYCICSNSEKRSAQIAVSVMRKLFYSLLAVICILGLASGLRSCSSGEYERGYEAGYEAGVEDGIALVKEDPSAYFG